MAFQFVPNADGSFTEGDKQTNPETNQEYIFTDGAWRPLGIEVATDLTELDERYLQLSGGTLTNRLFFDRGSGGHNFLISPNSSDTSTSMYAMNSGALRLRTIPGEDVDSGSTTHIGIGKAADGTPETYIYHLQDPQDELWGVNKRYVDSNYLPLTGGTLTGSIDFQRGSKDTPQFKISPNSGSDYATNIYSLNSGTLRLRTSHTVNEGDHVGSHIILDPNGGTPQTKIYNLIEPTTPLMAANKKYVDEQVGGPGTALRPPGLRFQYQTGSDQPTTGKFIWFTSGGNQRLKINATSLDFPWGTNTPVTDINYAEGHMFTIWAVANDLWKMKTTGTINRIDLHSDDILCYVSYFAPVLGSWSTSASYYITISGMF